MFTFVDFHDDSGLTDSPSHVLNEVKYSSVLELVAHRRRLAMSVEDIFDQRLYGVVEWLGSLLIVGNTFNPAFAGFAVADGAIAREDGLQIVAVGIGFHTWR